MVLSIRNSVCKAGMLGCLLASSASVSAQPAHPADKPLGFDLVSVRPLSPAENASGFRLSRSGFQAQGMPLDMMLAFAYDVDFAHGQVVGGPDWLRVQRFVIHARIAPADSAAFEKVLDDHTAQGQAQQQALVGRLLTNEFKLKWHKEDRPADVYSLGVADGGSKLKTGAAGGQIEVTGRPGHLVVKNLPFAAVLRILGDQSDRAIVDTIGLTGTYDFTLDWLARNNGPAVAVGGGDPKAPPFGTAVREQLGLTLEPKKAPLPYIVIDSAEKPVMDTLEAQLAAFPLQPGDFGTFGFYDQAPKINFSVVSFKRCNDLTPSKNKRTDMPLDSDYVAYHCQPISRLIYFAYVNAVDTYNVPVGFPAWVDSDNYEFIAKVAEPDVKSWQKLTIDQRRVVVRTLLADTLKLQMKLEMSPQAVYLLEPDKHGAKLAAAKPGEVGHLPDGRVQDGRTVGIVEKTAYFHEMALWDLASNLTGHLDHPVIDNTGLSGTYTFTLPAPAGQNANPHERWQGDDEGPTVAEGLGELGLKLTAAKVPMIRLVLDHVERPAEN
ncbi:MAG: TIGR03435 family protein [Acidobacteriota bacterium]|nr:TIGR03435 family protein [Acidobacteriota bacterium]